MTRDRAVVVELVGPAGAGKTTLAQGVSSRDRSVRAGLSLWGLPRPQLVKSTIALLPTILRSLLGRGRLKAAQIAQMIRLGALRRVVDDEAQKHRVILLDEGPVFALSWFDVFHSRDMKPVDGWRRRVVADWASLLDVVVFIDAADSTLAQRIREREKPHMVKNSSDEEIYGFSAGFRKAFDRVVAEFSRAGNLMVDALRTDRLREDESATRLMSALARRRNGN